MSRHTSPPTDPATSTDPAAHLTGLSHADLLGLRHEETSVVLETLRDDLERLTHALTPHAGPGAVSAFHPNTAPASRAVSFYTRDGLAQAIARHHHLTGHLGHSDPDSDQVPVLTCHTCRHPIVITEQAWRLDPTGQPVHNPCPAVPCPAAPEEDPDA